MCRGMCGWAEIMVRLVRGPKYNGKYLHDLIKGFLGDTKLAESLTNVVIPCFDIKKLQPVIFSSYQVNTNINPSTYIYSQNRITGIDIQCHIYIGSE